MGHIDSKDINNSRISSRLREVIVLIVAILIGIIISVSSNGQGFKKNNARHYKSLYKSQINTYANACSIFEKKRNQKPRSTIHFFSQRPDKKSMAEIEPGPPVTSTKSKPVEKKAEIAALKSEVVSKKPEATSTQKMDNLHDKEDEVLKENQLPAPTSEKHERIRKAVADNLKNKKDSEPISLVPLFFTYNQDEFSVVDMDPFLVAVEYALQGRTILIEGHTDNHGNDQYNVQLSIKRVQKIRQLMHDMGVPDDRISVIGYGEEVAQHDNTTEKGRQMNRRVDFKAF